MASLNKIQIIGNVGKEPEMRFVPSGKPVSTFNVGTNTKYKGADGHPIEETEWFSIVCWGKLAELVNQYLIKGSTVYVEGRNKTRSWEKDGVKHYKTEVIAQTVKFLDKVGGRGGATGAASNGGAQENPPADDDDGTGDVEPMDLPF